MNQLQNPLIDVNYRMSATEVNEFRKRLNEFLESDESLIGQELGYGKGIIISAGGLKYFTCAYVLVTTLRKLGCNLPIEVWYYDDELSLEMRSVLSALGADCRDISTFVDGRPHGFLMKPLSILYSAFEEVLFLDADNNCTKNPEYLFEEPAYLKHGCIFWPDYWEYSAENQIWEILNITPLTNLEQESGQLLINKRRCWKELQLATYLNINADDIYRFMYGDKNTYQIAWSYLESPYYFIKTPPGACGYKAKDNQFHGITMSQYDPNGEIIFLHRNLQKWDVTPDQERAWLMHKSFKKDALERACTIHGYKNSNYIDLQGDVDVLDFTMTTSTLEEACLKSLDELRSFPFYKDELLKNYIQTNR